MKVSNVIGAMVMMLMAGMAIVSDHESKVLISVVALMVAVLVATGLAFVEGVNQIAERDE